jgi:DNA-binding NtrC family response regulator
MVISDLRMSDGGAIKVLKNRNLYLNSEVPIAVMSGNADEYRQEIIDNGACCILNKPISMTNLTQLIKEKLNLAT